MKRFALVILIPALAIACGKSGSSARLPCELLPAEAVGAALGRSVHAVNSTGEGSYGACSYFDDDAMYSFGIEVVWTGGRQQWEELSAARGLAPQLSEDAAETAALVRAGPVEGLGDAAWYNELTGSHVLVGDTLIGFKVVLLPDPKRQFRPLAEQVVARLRD